MINHLFCCLAETTVGDRQKPSRESGPDKECIFDWFQIFKGLEVKCSVIQLAIMMC